MVVSHHEDLLMPNLDWMIGRRIARIWLAEPASWWFGLAAGGSIRADTLWRIVADGRVQATSADHGQAFGLHEPVDSAVRATLALSNAAVRRASVLSDTGDVVLDFDNDCRLEILTTSTGDEGWSVMFPNGDEAIALGAGQDQLRRRDG